MNNNQLGTFLIVISVICIMLSFMGGIVFETMKFIVSAVAVAVSFAFGLILISK